MKKVLLLVLFIVAFEKTTLANEQKKPPLLIPEQNKKTDFKSKAPKNLLILSVTQEWWHPVNQNCPAFFKQVICEKETNQKCVYEKGEKLPECYKYK